MTEEPETILETVETCPVQHDASEELIDALETSPVLPETVETEELVIDAPETSPVPIVFDYQCEEEENEGKIELHARPLPGIFIIIGRLI